MSSDDLPKPLNPFCCEEKLDEYKLAIDLLGGFYNNKKVLSFIIVSTTACNFRCSYCYEEHTDLVIDQKFIDNFLSALRGYHVNHPIERINIEWFGGEPLLLYDTIVDITKKLNKWCEKKEINYSYSATTNGYYLTVDKYEKLSKLGFSRFTVTVDGFEDIHNKYRKLKTGKGTWRRISDNLRMINESPVKCQILLRANYNYELLSEMDEYIKFLRNNYANEKFIFFFYPIKHWGSPNDKNIDVVAPSVYREATNIILDSMNEANMPTWFYNEKLIFAANVCYAAKKFHFVLNTDGKLYKCTFLDAPHNCVGDINSGTFELNNNKNANYCTPDYVAMTKKGCFECNIFPLCFGLCCPNYNILTKSVRCMKESLDIGQVMLNEYDYLRKRESIIENRAK